MLILWQFILFVLIMSNYNLSLQELHLLHGSDTSSENVNPRIHLKLLNLFANYQNSKGIKLFTPTEKDILNFEYSSTPQRIAEQLLNLKEGETIYIAGGWPLDKHGDFPLLYQFQLDSEGGLRFTLFNAGNKSTGLRFHAQQMIDGKELYDPTLTYTISKNDINSFKLESLLSNLKDINQTVLLDKNESDLNKINTEMSENFYANLNQMFLYSNAEIDNSTPPAHTLTRQHSIDLAKERLFHQLLKSKFNHSLDYQKTILDFKIYSIKNYLNKPSLLAKEKIAIASLIKRNYTSLSKLKELTQQEKEDYLSKLDILSLTLSEISQEQAISTNNEKSNPGTQQEKLSFKFNLSPQKINSIQQKSPETKPNLIPLQTFSTQDIENFLSYCQRLKTNNQNYDLIKSIEDFIFAIPLENALADMTLEEGPTFCMHLNNIQKIYLAVTKEEKIDEDKFVEHTLPHVYAEKVYFLALMNSLGKKWIKGPNNFTDIHHLQLLKKSLSPHLNFYLGSQDPYIDQKILESRSYYERLQSTCPQNLSTASSTTQTTTDKKTYKYNSLITQAKHLIHNAALSETFKSKAKEFLQNTQLNEDKEAIEACELTGLYYILNAESFSALPQEDLTKINQLKKKLDVQAAIDQALTIIVDKVVSNHPPKINLRVNYHAPAHYSKGYYTIGENEPSYETIPTFRPEKTIKTNYSRLESESETVDKLLYKETVKKSAKLADNDIYITRFALKDKKQKIIYDLKKNSLVQIPLALDFFTQHIEELKDKSTQNFFESLIFEPGLLHSQLQTKAFFNKWNDLIKTGITHFNEDKDQTQLFFVKMDYLVKQYAYKYNPESFHESLKALASTLTQLVEHTVDLKKKSALQEYRFLTLIQLINKDLPIDEQKQILSDLLESFLQADIQSNPFVKSVDIPHKDQLNAAKAKLLQYLEENNKKIDNLGQIVKEALTKNNIIQNKEYKITNNYPLFTLAHEEQSYSVDLQRLTVDDKQGNSFQAIPSYLYNHHLIKKFISKHGLSIEGIPYVCSPDEKEHILHFPSGKIKFIENYDSYIIKKYEGDVEFELLTFKENEFGIESLKLPAAFFNQGIPFVLRDNLAWIQSDKNHPSSTLIITNDKGETLYTGNKNQENWELIDNNNYQLCKTTKWPQLEVIEHANYMVSRKNKNNGTYQVELPRYGLSFYSTEAQPNILTVKQDKAEFRLAETNNRVISPGVVSVALENVKNPDKRIAFIAVLPFFLSVSNVSSEYFGHQIPNPSASQDYNKNFKKKVDFKIFDLCESNEPLAKNSTDALYLAYLYAGSGQYDKAFAMLKRCENDFGGIRGSEEERKYLHWLSIFPLPASKKEITNPPLIACQLKALTIFVKGFNNNQKIILASEETLLSGQLENGVELSKKIKHMATSYLNNVKKIPNDLRLNKYELEILLNYIASFEDLTKEPVLYNTRQKFNRQNDTQLIFERTAVKKELKITQLAPHEIRAAENKLFVDSYPQATKLEDYLDPKLKLGFLLKNLRGYVALAYGIKDGVQKQGQIEGDLVRNREILKQFLHAFLIDSHTKFDLDSRIIKEYFKGLYDLTCANSNPASMSETILALDDTNLRSTLRELYNHNIHSQDIYITSYQNEVKEVHRPLKKGKAQGEKVRLQDKLNVQNFIQIPNELEKLAAEWKKNYVAYQDKDKNFETLDKLKKIASQLDPRQLNFELSLTNLREQLEEQEGAIFKLLERLQNNAEIEVKLKIKARDVLKLDQLLTLFFKNDLKEYKKATFLSEAEISALHLEIAKYIAVKLQQQQLERSQLILDKIEKTRSSEEKNAALFALAKGLFAENEIDTIKEPALAVFQLKQNILIRPEQKRVIVNLLTKTKGKYHELVEEIMMGGGKSKVIIPTLAHQKATGDNLVIIEVPNALLETNYQDLTKTSANLFNTTPFLFKFNRNSDCSPKALEFLYQRLQTVIKSKGYIVTNGESVQSLALKYRELFDNIPLSHELDKQKIWTAQVIAIENLLALFKTKGDVIIDEVHEGLEVKNQLNYTRKNAKAIDSLVPEQIFSFYQFLNQTTIEGSRLDELFFNAKKVTIPENIYKKIAEKLIEAEESPLNTFLKDKSFDKNLLINYLLDQGDALHYKIPKVIEDAPDDIKQMFALYKFELSTLLGSTLTRKLGSEYGPSELKKQLNERLIAMPYEGSERAKERLEDNKIIASEFNNILETINLTFQYFIIKGLPKELLEQFIDNQKTKAKQELLEKNLSFENTAVAKAFKDAFETSLSKFNLEEHYENIYKNPKILKAVLENEIFSNFKVNESVYSSNAYNHADLYRSCQGLTAKLPYFATLSKKIQFDSQYTKARDHLISSTIKEKNTAIHGIDLKEPKSYIKDIFKNCNQENNLHAIIDVSDTFAGISNLEVAKLIETHLAENNYPYFPALKYILYFNKENMLSAWPINGDKTPIVINSTDPQQIYDILECQPDERITYYDKSHAFGIDIEQCDNSKAAVLVDKDTTSAAFFQACLRKRGFIEAAQTLTIVGPSSLVKDQSSDQLIEMFNKNQEKYNAFQAGILEMRSILQSQCLDAISKASSFSKVKLAEKCKPMLTDNISFNIWRLYGELSESKDSNLILDNYKKSSLKSWRETESFIEDKNYFDQSTEILESKIDHLIQLILKNCAAVQPIRIQDLGLDVETQQQMQMEVQLDKQNEIENIKPILEAEPYMSWINPNTQELKLSDGKPFRELGVISLSKMIKKSLPKNEYIPDFANYIECSKNFYMSYKNQSNFLEQESIKPVLSLMFFYETVKIPAKDQTIAAEKYVLQCRIITQDELNELSAYYAQNSGLQALFVNTNGTTLFGEKEDFFSYRSFNELEENEKQAHYHNVYYKDVESAQQPDFDEQQKEAAQKIWDDYFQQEKDDTEARYREALEQVQFFNGDLSLLKKGTRQWMRTASESKLAFYKKYLQEARLTPEAEIIELKKSLKDLSRVYEILCNKENLSETWNALSWKDLLEEDYKENLESSYQEIAKAFADISQDLESEHIDQIPDKYKKLDVPYLTKYAKTLSYFITQINFPFKHTKDNFVSTQVPLDNFKQLIDNAGKDSQKTVSISLKNYEILKNIKNFLPPQLQVSSNILKALSESLELNSADFSEIYQASKKLANIHTKPILKNLLLTKTTNALPPDDFVAVYLSLNSSYKLNSNFVKGLTAADQSRFFENVKKVLTLSKDKDFINEFLKDGDEQVNPVLKGDDYGYSLINNPSLSDEQLAKVIFKALTKQQNRILNKAEGKLTEQVLVELLNLIKEPYEFSKFFEFCKEKLPKHLKHALFQQKEFQTLILQEKSLDQDVLNDKFVQEWIQSTTQSEVISKLLDKVSIKNVFMLSLAHNKNLSDKQFLQLTSIALADDQAVISPAVQAPQAIDLESQAASMPTEIQQDNHQTPLLTKFPQQRFTSEFCNEVIKATDNEALDRFVCFLCNEKILDSTHIQNFTEEPAKPISDAILAQLLAQQHLLQTEKQAILKAYFKQFEGQTLIEKTKQFGEKHFDTIDLESWKDFFNHSPKLVVDMVIEKFKNSDEYSSLAPFLKKYGLNDIPDLVAQLHSIEAIQRIEDSHTAIQHIQSKSPAQKKGKLAEEWLNYKGALKSQFKLNNELNPQSQEQAAKEHLKHRHSKGKRVGFDIMFVLMGFVPFLISGLMRISKKKSFTRAGQASPQRYFDLFTELGKIEKKRGKNKLATQKSAPQVKTDSENDNGSSKNLR